MHEIAGKRMNRYHELGQYAFGRLLRLFGLLPQQHPISCLMHDFAVAGPRLGLWAVVPFQLIVMIGLGEQQVQMLTSPQFIRTGIR